jgi:hypothetical protein
MSWQTNAFIGALAFLVLLACILSFSGLMLPSTSEAGALSLRNVQARRTHFVRHYAFGK